MDALLYLLACANPVSEPADPAITADSQAVTADSAVLPGATVGPRGGLTPLRDGVFDAGAPSQPVRFVALGDAGQGDSDQFDVGRVMADVCARQGCDFALYLGDNFYPTGVESADDAQFEYKFEEPYADLDIPFHVALGNHDYGADGAGYEIPQAEYQIAYTEQSTKWSLPDFYYGFQTGDVHFWALDTNAIFWGDFEAQLAWFEQELAEPVSGWRIAFGHHPYVSNGDHGNAGEYQGFEQLPFSAGEDVKTFMEATVCGGVDLYLCGHDHSLQWLEPTCGTEFIVSGAGSATTSLDGDDPVRFEAMTHGFVWIEILADTLSVQFWSMDGTLLHEGVITK